MKITKAFALTIYGFLVFFSFYYVSFKIQFSDDYLRYVMESIGKDNLNLIYKNFAPYGAAYTVAIIAKLPAALAICLAWIFLARNIDFIKRKIDWVLISALLPFISSWGVLEYVSHKGIDNPRLLTLYEQIYGDWADNFAIYMLPYYFCFICIKAIFIDNNPRKSNG